MPPAFGPITLRAPVTDVSSSRYDAGSLVRLPGPEVGDEHELVVDLRIPEESRERHHHAPGVLAGAVASTTAESSGRLSTLSLGLHVLG
jgi:hypothetical protein